MREQRSAVVTHRQQQTRDCLVRTLQNDREISRTNYKIFIRCKHEIYRINILRVYHDRAGGQSAHLTALVVATEVEGEASASVEYRLSTQETHLEVGINPSLTTDRKDQLK